MINRRTAKRLGITLALPLLLMPLTACGSDSDDPEAGETTCGAASDLIIDAAGSDHYTVRETSTPLPLDADNGGRYTCSITMSNTEVLVLLADFDVEHNTIEDIEQSDRTFEFAGGVGGIMEREDTGEGYGAWRCGDVRVVVNIYGEVADLDDREFLNAADTADITEELTKTLAERAGCGESS